MNSIAEKRIIILDGAMGSIIQVLNLDEKSYRGGLFADHPIPLVGCNDLLCLTRPGAIGAIHDTYLEAGADIIETCSFNSTSVTLSDYGLANYSYEISAAAARIAKKSADKFSSYGKPRFVAGSIGPTAKGASLYPDINNPGKRSIVWDELESAYYDNARGLLDGGADIFLVETIFDTLNAKAAIHAITRLLEERQIDVPVIISAAISGESERLLSGQNLEAFIISVLHVKPWAIGLNCSFNAPKLLPYVRSLSKIVPCLVSAYPNAGLPNKFGRYEEMPNVMADNMEQFFSEGLVNIIGGCCGSTPAHIAAIADKAQNYLPRKISNQHVKKFYNGFSGLEPFYADNKTVPLINTESSVDEDQFKKALADGEYEDAADIARDIIENGSAILNIEITDKNNINEKAINSFLDYALMNPYIAKAPFFINSLDQSVLIAGLKRIQGRGFAGPVNLKNGEKEFLYKIHIIQRYGAAAVVTLIDEQENNSSLNADGTDIIKRKIEISGRIFKLLQETGYPVQNIVFAPNMTENGPSSVSTADSETVCSWIRDNCPGALIAL